MSRFKQTDIDTTKDSSRNFDPYLQAVIDFIPSLRVENFDPKTCITVGHYSTTSIFMIINLEYTGANIPPEANEKKLMYIIQDSSTYPVYISFNHQHSFTGTAFTTPSALIAKLHQLFPDVAGILADDVAKIQTRLKQESDTRKIKIQNELNDANLKLTQLTNMTTEAIHNTLLDSIIQTYFQQSVPYSNNTTTPAASTSISDIHRQDPQLVYNALYKAIRFISETEIRDRVTATTRLVSSQYPAISSHKLLSALDRVLDLTDL